jgi:hypothetical protein
MEEVRAVRTLVGRVLANPKVYPLTERQRKLVEGVERRLSEILRRGEFSRTERTWLIWTAKLMMASVF